MLRLLRSSLFAVALVTIAAVVPAAAQSVTTSQRDYAPGQVVTIVGAGWLPGEQVILFITQTPPLNGDVTLSSIADKSGAFTNTDFTVPTNADLTSFTVTATGTMSGVSATATFTDALPAKGSLCAAVPGAGDTVCPTATGAVGVAGGVSSPTNQHYKQVIGTTPTYVILGATDAVVDTTGTCAGQVKMHLENEITGLVEFCSSSLVGSTITFHGPPIGCQITLVDYKVGVSSKGVDLFRSANNDIVADGVDDGTPNGGAGIQYVYPTGEVVSCAATTTEIHDSLEQVIVSAAPGTVVHDKAVVTGVPAFGTPQGTVTFTFYPNDTLHTCSGAGTFAGTLAVDANGIAHPSLSFGPLAAGDYSFRAKFKPVSGPYNNHGNAYSYSECEPLSITQTAITTDIKDANNQSITTAQVGDAVHDTATVTVTPPSVIPSGSTVTFNLYATGDCSGAFTTDTVPVPNGSSSATVSSSSVLLTAAGAISFRATFNSGDLTKASNAVSVCEPLAVTKRPTTVTTQVHDPAHTDITGQAVPLGTTVHDSATVGGGAPGVPITGTVTYQFFTNGSCSGAPASQEVVSAGTESSAQTPSAGSYSYLASYSGDSNYAASTGTCEPITINKGSTSVTTQVHNPLHVDITGQTVALGSTIHDSAAVSGQVAPFTLTGTVTYQFFVNGSCAGTPTAQETVAVGSESTPQTPGAGAYAYLASYNGDANYAASNGACEPFTIARARTSVATQVHNPAHVDITGQSVALGSTVHDSAVVTGQVSPFALTGFVTYQFFTNGSCSGTPSTQETVGLGIESTPQTPGVGAYSYLAVYGGDANYLPATGVCEPFTIGRAPTAIVTQVLDPGELDVTNDTILYTAAVHDSSVVNGQVGLFALTGTVTYRFFTNATCSGTPAAQETVAVGSATSLHNPGTPGGYSFNASYNGDANYLPSTGACEPFWLGGPNDKGGLTMGFWHNKNGQAIILGGASTGGVCNSATWLRQFAPFQDLSASATCSQVASYVLKIINAANAAGAAMNAMLKAQMLATALDTYFGDPALGGNKTGSPSPFGGNLIDLTHVQGQNVGQAFGGATSMTVMQLLTYAASQSNSGGTIWYAQVKSIQELAKNTFDAINNNVATLAP